MKISEIMNKALAIEEKTSLKEAAKIMSDKNVGGLIVMKGDKVSGIVSESDILKSVSNLGKKVSEVMNKKVISIDKSDSVEDAAEIMAQNKIKRLPVFSKGELVGIVTATDILAHSEAINDDFFFD
ncbi:MAG: CBS domain-containing protein [Nanoarchaeota archaeon]|nr:CBS domain-containing protein [Nanoarchaeota archaeon]MBU4086953.1 CBS domain-containing protein [Nanoarchaeota archaeon]